MKAESSFFSVIGFFILKSFLSFVKKRVLMYNKCIDNKDFYIEGEMITRIEKYRV